MDIVEPCRILLQGFFMGKSTKNSGWFLADMTTNGREIPFAKEMVLWYHDKWKIVSVCISIGDGFVFT